MACDDGIAERQLYVNPGQIASLLFKISVGNAKLLSASHQDNYTDEQLTTYFKLE